MNAIRLCARQTVIIVDDEYEAADGNVFKAVRTALEAQAVPATLMPHATAHSTLEIIVNIAADADLEDCEPHEAILGALELAAIPASLVMRTSRPVLAVLNAA